MQRVYTDATEKMCGVEMITECKALGSVGSALGFKWGGGMGVGQRPEGGRGRAQTGFSLDRVELGQVDDESVE